MTDDSRNLRHEWIGALIVVITTAWLVSHAHPELWITNTWATGGDVASQVFYANVFAEEWFWRGKLSGWLPESFAGFPAFTYYFPFPFSLIALLSPVVGTQVAFKLVNMAPAFLLPAATYLMLAMWRLPVALRLAGMVGAAGFILTEETSIWGGNILAQLAGEFAYSWGLLLTVIFWGVLGLSFRRGKGWWLLAAACEAVVALSHGYALLMAGFGAFLLLFMSTTPWRDLRTLLAVHAVAFLLIGFWLIPLIENLRWTIPNDTSTHVNDISILWPRSLWPFALGAPLALIALVMSQQLRPVIATLISFALLGMLAFFAGHSASLAELRFFPFAQWAAAVVSGVGIGWALTLTRLSSLPLAAALVIALMAYWAPNIKNPEQWSRWNLEGYETKPMWSAFKEVAQLNAGPLDGPRVIFEHDPDNNDIGSTRTMEALPLFGSRPALEGLYMESAITSPFIYQLQEQISKRPSSPLSRYPTTPRTLDHTERYLNELYTNRLILRSEYMKKRYAEDPRYKRIAEVGPFHVLEFTQLKTHFVDVVTDVLVPRGREKWLDDANRRFSLSGDYSSERFVFLGKNQSWAPPVEPGTASETIPRIVEFDRERLVFETEAVGQPHIIRMTFHPRWKSTSGEAVYLVEPSFMLVIPQNKRVELVYGWSWGDYVGAVFTIISICIIGIVVALRWRGFWPTPSATTTKPIKSRTLLIAFACVTTLALGSMALTWVTDPEHVYSRGHRYFANNQWLEAAKLFDKVVDSRRVPAARAEALFWAARTFDLAGEISNAEPRYQQLVDNYPENFWYPESIHRLIIINADRDERDHAMSLFNRLLVETPNSQWTARSREFLKDRGWYSD